MRDKLFIVLIFTLFVPCAFSVPLERIVTTSLARQLRSSSEIIIETQTRNPSLKIMPENGELRQYVNSVQNVLSPDIMVEALFLLEKPGKFHTSADFWDSGQKTGIFNQITAISTLAGIQYFSATRNAMRTFYEISTVIDGQSSKNPLPDPVFNQVPASLSLIARQKDLTFGDNIYRYDYKNSSDVIYFTQENLTSLTYGIIPAIRQGNLRSVIAIMDCGDSLLIYAVSMAKAASFPGIADRINSSFSNRAVAFLDWLTGRLNTRIFN